ncbi:MAG TPA: NACHT domain-containing protein [Solirubrobacterales bacterium]|jgi:hypothetical protein
MRILAAEANEKGDLFARLVRDVFLALGYQDVRLNIHKTGREIDIKARHRLEPKKAIGECKASGEPIGGNDLNKFAGVLQLEAQASEETVQGYFVSLSGFRESAVEQESEPGGERFVLLDGDGVERELVAGGMVVSPEIACEAAGRLAHQCGVLTLQRPPKLLAHELGWLWLCEYGTNRQATHFGLIHADGEALAAELAARVVEADREVGGSLEQLEYLPPSGVVGAEEVSEAKAAYLHYLLTELGDITLEGLPADEEAGARRIALEDLYVPVKVVPASEGRQRAAGAHRTSLEADGQDVFDDPLTTPGEFVKGEALPESVGTVLSRESRLAILAAPGAGKSTLVKRLAVAYASEEHRKKVADDLPDTQWLPIFIRCRSLGKGSRDPILDILARIPERGEFPEHGSGFNELLRSSLVHGSVLLLVDGLDEISDPGDRLAFVLQLRTFLSTYPNASLILTSREAGFRLVGGAVSSMCEWYELGEFDDEDITALTKAWHATVVGQTKAVAEEAGQLAETIIATDRVKRLARNPLLLTTLLLVKRWVGDLPRKRTLLYEKAIEVLLMTWNVEAHDPIDREEAIPQLAFVAHSLTARGRQSLTATTLADLLTEAREQMPEILSFARISVGQFVEEIESRSSLLIMTGHDEENGVLVPVYEFRHLTFQEYLAAVALVEGFYRDRTDDDRLIDQLQPHLSDARWFEVIALANVRAGRAAGEVVSRMLELIESPDSSGTHVDAGQIMQLLGRALADEVQLSPALVARAARASATNRERLEADNLLGEIVEGKYGNVFEEAVRECYFDDEDPNFIDFASTYMLVAFRRWSSMDEAEAIEWLTAKLDGESEVEAAEAALCVMQLVFKKSLYRSSSMEDQDAWRVMSEWSTKLIALCETGRPAVAYAATWALAWLGDIDAVRVEDRGRGLRALLGQWLGAGSDDEQRQAAWAFSTMPEVERAEMPLGEGSPELCEFIEEQVKDEAPDDGRDDRRPAAIILAFYLRKPWTDAQIAELAESVRDWSMARMEPLRKVGGKEAEGAN